MSQTAKVLRGVFIVLVSSYVLIFIGLCWLRYTSFRSTSGDLALYLQALWGFRNHVPTLSIMPGLTFWEIYLAPVILPLAWLSYWIPPVPLLLTLQTLAFAATAVIVFMAVQKKIGVGPAVLIGTAVLLHPAMQNSNLFEFHTLTLCLPLLSLFLLFEERQKIAWATAALVIGLFCREEVAGVLFVWGLFLARKNRGLGISIATFSVLWIGAELLLKVLAGSTNALVITTPVGGSPFRLDLTLYKFQTAFWMFAGFGFLSLYSPKKLAWAALPILFAVVTPYLTLVDFEFYYLCLFVPFLAFAAADAWPKIKRRKVAWGVVLVGVLIGNWWHTQAPWGRRSSMKNYRHDTYAREAEEILPKIGPTDSVAVPRIMAAHVSERPFVYFSPLAGPQKVVIDLHATEIPSLNKEGNRQLREESLNVIQDLQTRFGYRIAYRGKLMWLLEREGR